MSTWIDRLSLFAWTDKVSLLECLTFLKAGSSISKIGKNKPKWVGDVIGGTIPDDLFRKMKRSKLILMSKQERKKIYNVYTNVYTYTLNPEIDITSVTYRLNLEKKRQLRAISKKTKEFCSKIKSEHE